MFEMHCTSACPLSGVSSQGPVVQSLMEANPELIQTLTPF